MWLVGVQSRVYIVESGLVEIFRVLEDGSEERRTVIEAGDYFGELAPMFGLRRSAGARARRPRSCERPQPA